MSFNAVYERIETWLKEEELQLSDWELEAFRHRAEIATQVLALVWTLEDHAHERQWVERAAYEILSTSQRRVLREALRGIGRLVETLLPDRIQRLATALDASGPIGSTEVAVLAQAVVVSIDYRLGPEHPFPAAVDDALTAARWVGTHLAELGGSQVWAMAGDSAGGGLTAVATHVLRDERRSGAGADVIGPPMAAQLLIYPATDATMSSPSVHQNANAPILTKRSMVTFRDHYLGPGHDHYKRAFASEQVIIGAGLSTAVALTASGR